MVQINSEYGVKSHRRHLILGGMLLMLSLLCVAMTVMFVFVSNNANRKVEDIRQQYRTIADRRELRVAELTNQLAALQAKLDVALPATESSPADKQQGESTPPPTSR